MEEAQATVEIGQDVGVAVPTEVAEVQDVGVAVPTEVAEVQDVGARAEVQAAKVGDGAKAEVAE